MKMDEAITLGRRLREGSLSPSAALQTHNAGAVADHSLEAAAMTSIDAISPDAPLDAAVAARDTAESLLVFLGAIGAVEAERRLASRLAEVDARMLARRDEWCGHSVATSDPWLRRMAELDASSWWLDLVALAQLRTAAKAFDPAAAFRDVSRPRMALRKPSSAAERRLHAEVVGMDDDPARVAIERGAVVARLFDGEVEVHAVGLRSDQHDLPAGLCIARRGGGVADITHVALGGVAGGKGHSGWWTTLPDTGSFDLVVRLGDREESLPLDVHAP